MVISCFCSAGVTCHPFVIISFSHHKYTPNAHFCQFTFLFTSLTPPCTGFPYLNPFASASLNRSGTGKSQAQKLLPQIRPFQWYHLGVDRTPTSADAPSAQDESISHSFCFVSFFITKPISLQIYFYIFITFQSHLPPCITFLYPQYIFSASINH
jgi:hypothetical protein